MLTLHRPPADGANRDSRASCVVDRQDDESVGVHTYARAQGADEGALSGEEEQAGDVCAPDRDGGGGGGKRMLRGARQRQGRSGQRRGGAG